jgi:hypothetical protein
MADDDHLAQLRKGVAAWNDWRKNFADRRCGRLRPRRHVPPLNFKPIIVHGDQVL